MEDKLARAAAAAASYRLTSPEERAEWLRHAADRLEWACSCTPRTSCYALLYLEELFRGAGFPDDVFQTLLISSRRVEQVLRDPRVAAATLTGSEPAGRSVATIAASEIKKVVFEMLCAWHAQI